MFTVWWEFKVNFLLQAQNSPRPSHRTNICSSKPAPAPPPPWGLHWGPSSPTSTPLRPSGLLLTAATWLVPVLPFLCPVRNALSLPACCQHLTQEPSPSAAALSCLLHLLWTDEKGLVWLFLSLCHCKSLPQFPRALRGNPRWTDVLNYRRARLLSHCDERRLQSRGEAYGVLYAISTKEITAGTIVLVCAPWGWKRQPVTIKGLSIICHLDSQLQQLICLNSQG